MVPRVGQGIQCACGDQVPGRAAMSKVCVWGGRVEGQIDKKESFVGSEVGARRSKEGVETVEGVLLQPPLLDHGQPRVLVIARSAVS